MDRYSLLTTATAPISTVNLLFSSPLTCEQDPEMPKLLHLG